MNAAQKATANNLRSNLTDDQRIGHFYRVAPGIVRRGESDYFFQVDSYSAPTKHFTLKIDGSVVAQ